MKLIVSTPFWLLLSAGCMPQTPVGSPPGINESAVLADVANGLYRTSAQFMPVSRDPYPSAIAASNISVWVTAPDWAAYSKISPEQSGSGASVSAGTLIVREVRDGMGAVQKLTLMMKGPAGYNPQVGDFWFGVTQPDGTPMMQNGAKQMGKLSECFGCHITRANDGYLFGVPASNRAPVFQDGGVPPGLGDGGMPAHDGGVVGGGGGAAPAGDMGACGGPHHHGGCDMGG